MSMGHEKSNSRNASDDVLRRRGLRLAVFIIVWDVIEGVVAVTAGIRAGSIALVGFGIDSSIEVFAASVVVWQLRGASAERRQRALRLIAITFYALAAYVAVQATRDLVVGDEAGESIVGIILNVVALAAMIPVAISQRRTGSRLGNDVLVAQSSETWISNYLSIGVLVGLGLNALLGWWWADPLAALGIAAIATKSGRDAWQESKEKTR